MKEVRTKTCPTCGQEALEADGLREQVSRMDGIVCKLPQTGGGAWKG